METIVQALIFIVGSTALALLGVRVVRRRVPLDVQMEQNEVAGFFIAVLGVVYGVLLAFAVIVVWEGFEDARQTAEAEANDIGDIYRLAQGLPDGPRTAIQRLAVAYGRTVIDEEWPAMARRQESTNAFWRMADLWDAVRAYEPVGAREEAIYGKLLDAIQGADDNRRMRLLASREGVPHLIWGVLIGGGVVTVLFTYFFGLKNERAHLAMTAMYVVSIGFVLFLIAAINFPFSGVVAVTTEPMELVLRRIELLAGDGRP